MLFSVLFFCFPFCFRSVSCLLSVLEGTGFTITSFAQGETGPAVVFPERSLTLPLCPKSPHAESRGGGGGSSGVRQCKGPGDGDGSSQRKMPMLGGVLKLYLKRNFCINKRTRAMSQLRVSGSQGWRVGSGTGTGPWVPSLPHVLFGGSGVGAGMSHWQLLLTAPAASAKRLRHLRGGAAPSCPSSGSSGLAGAV